MENFAAGVSGATLGYIVGNIPGGYYGWKLARNMAPITRAYKKKLRANWKKLYRDVKRHRAAGLTGKPVYTSGGKQTTLDSIVTRQKDYSKQYTFHKMPKYKKRRWRNFVKKVAAVQLKQAGLKTVVFNSQGTLTNDVGFQQICAISLYGFHGTLDNNEGHGHKDLYRIFKNDPDIIQTGTAPNNVPTSGKLQFGSAVLDVTIRNLGEIEAEVDVYTGWYRKDSDKLGATTTHNPITKYKDAPQTLINTGNQVVDIYQRGATVFDKPTGISEIGYHIHKKTKLVLAPGESTFLSHRDAKNHMIDWSQSDNLGFAKKGLTYGLWVVFKPTVTILDNAQVTLTFGVSRKFSYAVVEDNVDRVSYNPPQ